MELVTWGDIKALTTEAFHEIQHTPELLTPEVHQQVCDHGHVWIYDEQESARGYDPRVGMCPQCRNQARLRELQREIEASGIGERYFHTEWEDLELIDPMPRIKAATERITEVIESGENALLHGPPGGGKTQAAVLLVKAAIRAGHSARLDNLGRLGMDIRAGYDGDGASEAQTVNDLAAVGLLVLDDIGAGETGTAKVEQRILYLVTEARQNAQAPTVLTTNLTPQSLAATLGGRIVNRLQPLASIGFSHGRNFRKPTGQEGLW